jgi:hypothetical protein
VIVAANSLIDSDHPETTPGHELALMCDDIESTVAELKAKGATFAGGIHGQGSGS